jgi:hypothetical protein
MALPALVTDMVALVAARQSPGSLPEVGRTVALVLSGCTSRNLIPGLWMKSWRSTKG